MPEMNQSKTLPPVRPRAVRAGILLALVAASATGGCETMQEYYLKMEEDERDKAFQEWQASEVRTLNEGSGTPLPTQDPPPDPQNPQYPL
jgi:hypothetical protein